MNNTINLKEIFVSAFSITKKNFWNFLAVGVLFLLLSILGEEDSLILSLISIIGLVYINVCLTFAMFKLSDGESIKLKEFFIWPKNGFKMIFADILAKVFVIIPLFALGFLVFLSFLSNIPEAVSLTVACILLVIFIYFSIRLSLVKYHALASEDKILPSIVNAFKLTKGRVFLIFRFGLISLGLIIIGIILVLIGLLWAIPTVMIAQVLFYKAVLAKEFLVKKDENLAVEIQPVELPISTHTE